MSQIKHRDTDPITRHMSIHTAYIKAPDIAVYNMSHLYSRDT